MFSNPPLPSFLVLWGFLVLFWLLSLTFWLLCNELGVCFINMNKHSAKPWHILPLKSQIPPFHLVAVCSSSYFWCVLFTAFWCTYCTGTFKKQATEHKVKWRFISWKINIKKLTIYHLSRVSCIRLVLPTYSTTHIHDGHCWAPSHNNYFSSFPPLSVLAQHTGVNKYYLWRIKVVQDSHGLTT